MQLINQSYEIIPQASGLEGIYKHIEKAGRTCYKSEDKITEDSAEKFVERMINSKHTAMLEHGTVYLEIAEERCDNLVEIFTNNKYSKVNYHEELGYYFITTNFRVLVENSLLHSLKYLCEPTEHHEKRVTVKFTTNQGILREFTRHRVFSFAVESTRYCNYSKDKFGNEITYIKPWWLEKPTINDWESRRLIEGDFDLKDGVWYECCYNYQEESFIWNSSDWYLHQLRCAETTYFQLLKQGLKPEEARGVLPLDTKCDMIMTGFISDWKHFFNLRALGITGKPHPQAKELAEPLMGEFRTLGYI